MGRQFKQRASYLADARYLIRMQQAIEEDTSRPDAWRREASQHLVALITMFSADAQKVVEGIGKP